MSGEQIVEPWSCTGTAHEHRWIRFGRNGEREEAVVLVDADGHVDASEQLMAQLLADAGYAQHDPDPVEVEAAKRRSWARSRLQEALNRRAR